MSDASRPANLAHLDDRGVIEVSGPDAGKLLQGILTNDLDTLEPGSALLAALLTPQGKILFEFFVSRKDDGYLLETARGSVADAIKRLNMYKLRAQVAINDVSAGYVVVAAWGGALPPIELGRSYPDPRSAALGSRLLLPQPIAAKLAEEDVGRAAYDAHRIASGIAEVGRDYQLGDSFPHEANYDMTGGVSFSKGCYVGQEVVARMQNKTVVRKRVMPVRWLQPVAPGAEVKAGEAVIGTVGSSASRSGLAMVRIDRVAEALDKAQPLTAGGIAIEPDPDTIARYRASVAERQANTL